MVRHVVLVAPRGVCAGVVRAVDTVEAALRKFGAPVYVRRAIVHNPHLVARLAAAGAVFVHEVDDVPAGEVVVFSAHGVARSVVAAAEARGLRIVDATCPLVAKVHSEARRFVADGYDVVLIGREGHDEVVGTMGQVTSGLHLVATAADVGRLNLREGARVAVVMQTTLTPADVEPVIEALRARYGEIAEPRSGDVCFATRNRQMAARWLAERVDGVVVLGDQSSSNSRHLRDVAAAKGRPAVLVGTIDELDPSWLNGFETIGITSGASTPEDIVRSAVNWFLERGATLREETLLEEPVRFGLPRAVADTGPRGRAASDPETPEA